MPFAGRWTNDTTTKMSNQDEQGRGSSIFGGGTAADG
jgi:hypothetical protein